MPKIPVYKRQVELAAGQLSPRASSAAFEAPGRALAGLAESVGNVAYQFGMAEKNKQTLDKAAEVDDKVMRVSKQIEIDPQYTSATSAKAAIDTAKANIFGEIDSYDMTSNQKRQLKLSASKTFSLQGLNAELKAHGRGLQESGRNLATLMQNKTDAYIGLPDGDPRKDIIVSDMSVLREQARSNGFLQFLPKEFQTEQGTMFEMRKRQILSETADNTKTLDHFKSKRDEALQGKGYGEGMDAAQISQIAALLDGQVNYLEGPLLADANVEADNGLSSMRTAGKGQEQIDSAIGKYMKAGRPDLANDLQMKADVASGVFSSRDALTFASPTQIAAERARLQQADIKAVGTDRKRQTELTLEMFDKTMAARREAIASDPATYVIDNFRRKFPNNIDPIKGPSRDVIITAQMEMGLRGGQLKPFTASEVNSFNAAIKNAQDPKDVMDALANIGAMSTDERPVSRDVEAAGMRQLRAGEFSLALNYVAQSPNSPMSSSLLASAMPGGITINVTPQNRDMIAAEVRNNEVVLTHLKSMLGGTFVDYQGNSIRRAAGDTEGMRDAREQHIQMITNLATYLVQQDRKQLAGDNRVDYTTIAPYIDKAATVFQERYSYIDTFPNKNTSLRLPLGLSGNADFIQQRLNLVASTIKPQDVYFREKFSGETQATYDILKKVYVNETKGGFGWVISGDGTNAIMVDKNGGAVLNPDKTEKSIPIATILSLQAEQASQITAGGKVERPEAEITAYDVEAISQ